jgi:hypothetical protein
MSGIIRIDMPKGVEEGSTSVSPQSPAGGTLSSPPISKKGAIMLGYSVMTAKAVYSTAIQEIRAGGNEEMATAMENATTGVGIVIGAIATSGLSLIPQAISTATQIYTRERNNTRQNQAREYERSMRGSRINYMGGGGYE